MLTTDRIYHLDCREGLRQLAPGSIHLIFTSPPYGLGKHYGGGYKDTIGNALTLIWQIAEEAERVLVPGGRLVVNLAHHTGRSPTFPLESTVELGILKRTNLLPRGKITWVKEYSYNRTSWGSWCSQGDPFLIDHSEALLVFGKGCRLKGQGSDLSQDEFSDLTKNVWSIRPERDRTHAAPFPLELAERVVKLYCFPSQVVLDPCMGSGTTAHACQRLGRRFLGFELSEHSYRMACQRIGQDFSLGRAQGAVARSVTHQGFPAARQPPGDVADTCAKMIRGSSDFSRSEEIRAGARGFGGEGK